MKNCSNTLGERIVYYRKKLGLSQKELAAAVGMSPTAISYYETDKREPNILILMNLAKTLNITGDTLLGLEHPDLIAQTDDEYSMLCAYRALNSVGQERLLEYANSLRELPKYAEGLTF